MEMDTDDSSRATCVFYCLRQVESGFGARYFRRLLKMLRRRQRFPGPGLNGGMYTFCKIMHFRNINDKKAIIVKFKRYNLK